MSLTQPIGGDILGCMDPIANNYDPNATVDNGSCQYGNQFVGCMDPLALNYQPAANVDCMMVLQTQGATYLNSLGLWNNGTTCCLYSTLSDTGAGDAGGAVTPIEEPILTPIETPTEPIITPAEPIIKCPTTITCVSCDGITSGTIGLNQWNNTYIANHNGQSLQVTSLVLWQQIVNLVTNSGQTIYVNATNGEPLSQNCCQSAQGTFVNGVCLCQKSTEENYTPKCISSLTGFLNLISTTVGYSFFTTNFQTIGPSLGLTPQQTNFILLSINSTADSNNNNIQDLTEARLILSNALSATGGFYVNFGDITNTPIMVTKGVCDQNGGYWDTITAPPTSTFTGKTVGIVIPIGDIDLGGGTIGSQPTAAFKTVGIIEPAPIITPTPTVPSTNGNCMCKPIVDQCEIDITQIKTVNTFDFFNNPIQTVQLVSNSTPLSEACCNRLIKDYNLPWEWQAPYCLATKRDDCLPVSFSLNNKLMEVPPCENDLEISMWVYFGKPESPCQPIPDPPDTDIITIDGQFCDVTITPNTGAINPTLGGTVSSPTTPVIVIDTPTEVVTPKVCCYNINNPILANISLTNPTLNPFLTQVTTYNSSTNYFDRWVQIKATLPSSGLTLSFGVNLEITQGLNCCCDYNIFVDDIRVNCSKQEPSLIVNDIQCPGFNLTRVIDNKKSWVYNPGIPSVGISEYDNIERADGSFGMLDGEGTINRTFAPSLDADIPWRYTDYFKQSSVYEKHSNLVLNSKELWLTYDMCADCPISGTTLVCPSGYTLSASTVYCYDISGSTTTASTVNTLTYLSLYDLENYKKQFQSFWIPFMEQFIPATSIWVAGERWCNEPCTIINPCDYDFELVDSEVSYEQIPTGFFPIPPRGSTTITIPIPATSQIGNGVVPEGTTVTTTPLVTPVLDLGVKTATPILRTEAEASIDITSYRSRFTSLTTVTV